MVNEKSELSEKIPTASNAVNECHQVETAANGIVPMPVKRPRTSNVKRHPVTFTNTKRHPTVTTCQNCKGDFIAKRPAQARYCGSKCRREAWLKRNPEKALLLAENDKARLRAHLESKGIVWVEQGLQGGNHGA